MWYYKLSSCYAVTLRTVSPRLDDNEEPDEESRFWIFWIILIWKLSRHNLKYSAPIVIKTRIARVKTRLGKSSIIQSFITICTCSYLYVRWPKNSKFEKLEIVILEVTTKNQNKSTSPLSGVLHAQYVGDDLNDLREHSCFP